MLSPHQSSLPPQKLVKDILARLAQIDHHGNSVSDLDRRLAFQIQSSTSTSAAEGPASETEDNEEMMPGNLPAQAQSHRQLPVVHQAGASGVSNNRIAGDPRNFRVSSNKPRVPYVRVVHLAHVSGRSSSKPHVGSPAGSVDAALQQWLDSKSFIGFAPVLFHLGIATLADLHFALEQGLLSETDLVGEGLPAVAVKRFLRQDLHDVGQVSGRPREKPSTFSPRSNWPCNLLCPPTRRLQKPVRMRRQPAVCLLRRTRYLQSLGKSALARFMTFLLL